MQIHKYLLSLKVPINNRSSEIKIPGYCFKSFENLYSHYVPFVIPYLLLLALYVFIFLIKLIFFFIIQRRPSKLRVGISLITYQLGEHFSAYIRVIVLLFICFHNRLMMFLLLYSFVIFFFSIFRVSFKALALLLALTLLYGAWIYFPLIFV